MKRLFDALCGLLAAVALFAIMALTLVDVTGRKLFNHSITGSLELTEILMVVVIFGALPLVSWRGEHIVFDSLDGVVPRALKGLQHRVVHLLCAGTFAFLGLQLLKRAERFAEYGEVTAHLGLALAPVAWLMAALLGATALVHLLFVVQLPPGALEHVPHTPELPE